MPTTYEPIATTTLSSAQSDVTFSAIAGTYTDLILVCQLKANEASNTWMRFNGDTGTNYSYTVMQGNGSSAISARDTNLSNGFVLGYGSYPENNFNNTTIVHIQNYANTTTFKTSLVRSNNAAVGVDAVVGLWRSTSAITSVTVRVLSASAKTLSIGSTLTLYGIKSA